MSLPNTFPFTLTLSICQWALPNGVNPASGWGSRLFFSSSPSSLFHTAMILSQSFGDEQEEQVTSCKRASAVLWTSLVSWYKRCDHNTDLMSYFTQTKITLAVQRSWCVLAYECFVCVCVLMCVCSWHFPISPWVLPLSFLPPPSHPHWWWVHIRMQSHHPAELWPSNSQTRWPQQMNNKTRALQQIFGRKKRRVRFQILTFTRSRDSTHFRWMRWQRDKRDFTAAT